MKKKLIALATAFVVSLPVQVSASPVAKACLDVVGFYRRTLSSLDYDYAYGLNSFSTGSGYCGLQPVGTVVEAPQTKEH